MARAQDLAGLAALAGLGYMLSKKGDTAATDTSAGPGRQSLGAGYDSTETRLKTPAQSIADADKSSKSVLPDPREAGSEVPSASSRVFTQNGPDKNKRAEVYKANTPKYVENKTANAYPSMPGSTPSEDTSNYSNEGNSDVLTAINKKNGANTPSALRTDQLSVLSRANKRAENKKRFAQEVPEELSAQKTDALAVSSRATRRADALKRAAQSSPFKKGGAVKKMAKGGMTSKPSSASSRADGIASRGKTKCKMY